LRTFLEDPNRRTLEWPLAEKRRQHVHSRIDATELPVSHVTRRQGRPYTLVLQKTDVLFADELKKRARDQADLEWLAAEWHVAPDPLTVCPACGSGQAPAPARGQPGALFMWPGQPSSLGRHSGAVRIGNRRLPRRPISGRYGVPDWMNW
jgi:hypothetical protein